MITRAAVYHRPTDEFAYPISEYSIHIKIRTKRKEINSVRILFGDQFEWQDGRWIHEESGLEKVGTDALFDYWLVEIRPTTKRVRYGFYLCHNDEQLFYTEKGFYNEPPPDPSLFFCFPFLHGSDAGLAPEWVKNTVWYQIFPERFANGDTLNDPPETKAWASEEPSPTNHFGGDLQGILNWLDYLVSLGITGIYLTPIFKATSNHKYDTIDYMEIDPQFGTKETFKALVQACHGKGIKVMLDAVFNHCGYHFAPFQDVLANGEHSAYLDWFHTTEFPLQGGFRPNYATFAFEEKMPKLRTQHKAVKEYLLEVGRYWVREFDIDGWRLDVANEVDHAFWREFRQAMKELKPDIYILGEVWHDSMPWLRGDQFDSVMNYPFLTNVLQYFAYGHLSSTQFVENMTTESQKYPTTTNASLFNLLGSHDTKRILTECGGNIQKVKLIYSFMLTFTGTPCIYYGDEIGLSGHHDPGCRACMPWNKDQWNHELLEHIRTLITLRKENPILANEGTLLFLEPTSSSSCIAFIKKTSHTTAVVIFNVGTQEVRYTLPFDLKGKSITDLMLKRNFAFEASTLSVVLKPFSTAILTF